MTTQLSQIKWGRVLVTALAVSVLSFLLVFLIVTGYATFLAFQARGAPDQALIQAFANQYAPWIGPLGLILFTFLGAIYVARRVENAVRLHGLLVGALVSLVNLIFDGLSLSALSIAILTIAAGWLGSSLKMRRTTPEASPS
jgi:ATP/ADP translocase